MWSVAKICPINPAYDGQWYFYENTGKLAEKELAPVAASSDVASSGPESQTEQELPSTTEESRLAEDYGMSDTYYSMRRHLTQAHTAALALQDFRWHPFDSLTWESTNEDGVESSVLMSQVLPSADSVNPLLTQYDRCNALAVKGWLERPFTQAETTAQDATKPATHQWRALCFRLRSELYEAERKTAEVQLDAIEQLADIEHSLSTSPSSITETYPERFQTKRAEYIGLFNVVIGNLEQAERLAVKLGCWQFDLLGSAQHRALSRVMLVR